jgi:hypothetical protein
LTAQLALQLAQTVQLVQVSELQQVLAQEPVLELQRVQVQEPQLVPALELVQELVLQQVLGRGSHLHLPRLQSPFRQQQSHPLRRESQSAFQQLEMELRCRPCQLILQIKAHQQQWCRQLF